METAMRISIIKVVVIFVLGLLLLTAIVGEIGYLTITYIRQTRHDEAEISYNNSRAQFVYSALLEYKKVAQELYPGKYTGIVRIPNGRVILFVSETNQTGKLNPFGEPILRSHPITQITLVKPFEVIRDELLQTEVPPS